MRRTLTVLTVGLALLGCEKPGAPPQGNHPSDDQTGQLAAGPLKGVDRSHRGQPAPRATFNDPDGDEISLADFRGTPVLVNLWASWCAPCVRELPALDRFAAEELDSRQLKVIAVSQDTGPQASVEAFLAKLNAKELGAYHDPKMALSGALGPDTVLPTSILYDAQGRELWRYVGDLDWTGPEATRLLFEGIASGADVH